MKLPGRVGRRLQPLLAQRFVRFLLVGVLNTAFGYTCFALLHWAGLGDSLALFLATVAGVLFNFRTIGPLVFGSSDPRLLWRFVGVYAVIYTANVGALHLLEFLGVSALAGQAILALPVAAASFVLNRRFVFVHG